VKEAGRVVTWGLVFYAGMQLAAAYFAANKVGAAAVQAALAEWGAGRVAITWSDPYAPAPSSKAIALRALRGAALGAGVAAIVLLFAWLTRGATLAPTSPGIAALVLGLLVSALTAVRDELLFRGFVLRALGGAPWLLGLGVCALAGAAARFGLGDASPTALIIAGLEGLLVARLWQLDRGAWMAWGAHVAWAWVTGAVARGGLVDVRFSPGFWGGGDAGLEGSGATLVALALVVVTALFLAFRRREPA
jgi:hypothetical protein